MGWFVCADVRAAEFIVAFLSTFSAFPRIKSVGLEICRHDACLSHNFFATLVIVVFREQDTVYNAISNVFHWDRREGTRLL